MKRTLPLLLLILMITTGCQSPQAPSRPLIGITSVFSAAIDGSATNSANFSYVRALVDNGATPVILPTIQNEEAIDQYIDELDGLVLVGGADIPPSAYGQQPHHTVVIMPPQRYEFERRLIAKWLESDKPILGVCLGMQFTNVVSGGSLTQDIPSQIGTEVTHRDIACYHPVNITKGSTLDKLLETDTPQVLSYHHQAVKDLGRELKIIATSADGVPEALEKTDGSFGLFVQWHPESMTDLQHRNAIYGALVNACK